RAHSSSPLLHIMLSKERHQTATGPIRRNRAARHRHQATKARHDMRNWQAERRKRTRHLIELGGLVVKAGIVDLTGDDRTLIYGALLWIAAKHDSDEGDRAREIWRRMGKAGFEADRESDVPSDQ
ncbi:MAG: conjugal transfer protein TraD, partial [Marivita sp.]|uniref:conjugal transfer protein TraD n=1 Tax=Marivita sp. TaxID=2003365 RepID=UPI003EFAC728